MLAAYVSETVTIRYDPRDAGEVRVYHQDTYLCRAIAPELAAETITLQQLQQARGARRAALKQQLIKDGCNLHQPPVGYWAQVRESKNEPRIVADMAVVTP